jgi:hypothetical protein
VHVVEVVYGQNLEKNFQRKLVYDEARIMSASKLGKLLPNGKSLDHQDMEGTKEDSSSMDTEMHSVDLMEVDLHLTLLPSMPCLLLNQVYLPQLNVFTGKLTKSFCLFAQLPTFYLHHVEMSSTD